MGTWACLHAWHVCVSPAPSVCHVYGRKEQGHTHTRAHIHTCAPSHGKGGMTIASPVPLFVSPSLTGFFACPPTHTTLGRGSARSGATSCTDCNTAAGNYCPPGSTSSAGVPCPAGFTCPGGTSDKQACPKGKHLASTGNDAETDCVACAAGADACLAVL